MRHAACKSTIPAFPSTLTTLISYQLVSTFPPKHASRTELRHLNHSESLKTWKDLERCGKPQSDIVPLIVFLQAPSLHQIEHQPRVSILTNPFPLLLNPRETVVVCPRRQKVIWLHGRRPFLRETHLSQIPATEIDLPRPGWLESMTC